MSEIGDERLCDVPIAITLSKSDIVTGMLPGPFAFSRPSATEATEWLRERNVIHSEVIKVLRELEGGDIVTAAARAPRTTFHAVAPLGAEPAEDGRIEELRSLRCTDPVANVLLTILNT